MPAKITAAIIRPTSQAGIGGLSFTGIWSPSRLNPGGRADPLPEPVLSPMLRD